MKIVNDVYLSEEVSTAIKMFHENKEHLLSCIDECFEGHLDNAKALHKNAVSPNKDYYYGIIVAFNDARRIIRMYSEELEDIELRVTEYWSKNMR